MKNRRLMMTCALAGTAMSASAQLSADAGMEIERVNPKEGFPASVEIVRPGGASGTREIVTAYDTRFSGSINPLTGLPFNELQKTNWAHTTGASYTTVGTTGGWVWNAFTTNGPNGAPALTFNYNDDNGTPTNPNDDIVITAATDTIFDDYAFEPAVAARYGPGELATATIARTTWAPRYVTPEDVNGTPSNPNDDLFTRVNQLRMNFYGTNDNGTPTNPNDDFLEFVNGFAANFTLTAAAGTSFIQGLTITLTGGMEIPTSGLVMYDWRNNNGAGLGSDNGIRYAAVGGEANPADGASTGSDGIAVPTYDTIYRTGGAINTFGAGTWVWCPSGDARLIDNTADGNPSDTSYLDILLTGNGVDWSLGVAVGANNLGPGRVDLPETIALHLTVDAPEVCLADLSGSADPNDPGYGVPNGTIDASDFFYFLDQFVANNISIADISGSSDPNDPAYGVPDGTIDASDFFYYLDLFVLPCP